MTGWLYRGLAALWLACTLVYLAESAGRTGLVVGVMAVGAWAALGMAAAFAAGVEHEEATDA